PWEGILPEREFLGAGVEVNPYDPKYYGENLRIPLGGKKGEFLGGKDILRILRGGAVSRSG
ncbi:MAG TPA: hypothetical protein VKU02_19230, partial [Gemmataceae bacterium]|nr:hypothetical protein [Gemmataceae bacterium]